MVRGLFADAEKKKKKFEILSIVGDFLNVHSFIISYISSLFSLIFSDKKAEHTTSRSGAVNFRLNHEATRLFPDRAMEH